MNENDVKVEAEFWAKKRHGMDIADEFSAYRGNPRVRLGPSGRRMAGRAVAFAIALTAAGAAFAEGDGGGSGGSGSGGGAGGGGGGGSSGGGGGGGGSNYHSPQYPVEGAGNGGTDRNVPSLSRALRRVDGRAALQAEARGQARSLSEILSSLSRIAPGRVLSVEFEHRRYGYEYAFTVLTEDGHYLDVVLDAKTGRLISARTR